MAEQASDYHRGEMDIQEQVSTYNLIMGITKWGSLALVAFLVWAVLWFCTDSGFMGATISAIVVTVLGVLALRERKTGH
jgi:energy-converting hydrogenase Eha subunit B